MRTPAFLLVALIASSAGASPDAPVTSVDAFKAATMMSGDCRLVILGDSFAATSFSRLFSGFLNVWEQTPLTAAYIPGGKRPQLGVVKQLASPYTEVGADGPTGYTVLAATGSPQYVTLPVRGLSEFQGGPSLALGTGGGLIQYALRNDTLQDAPGGRMFTAGDHLRFRGIYWATPDLALMHNSLGLAVGGVTLDQFDPTLEARQFLHLGEMPDGIGRPAAPGQFNAFARDVDFTVAQSNPDGAITLNTPSGAMAEGEYVHAAGGVFTKIDTGTGQRQPGLYYSAVSGSSWSYFGFGSDRAPVFSMDKVFEQSSFTHWLDATTIDAQQPVVFVYYFAYEPFDVSLPFIESMIDQSAASAAEIGLTNIRHLLVAPHMHLISNIVDFNDLRVQVEKQRDKMYEIASRRPDVSAVSIYDATDGVFFDGSAEARDWLRANAPAPFEYAGNSIDLADGPLLGDLLDGSDLHPADNDAAAFYAKAFVDALLAPLTLDFNGDGILDNGDIGAFIAAFLGGQPSANLNGDGILDNGDISCFVARFLAEI